MTQSATPGTEVIDPVCGKSIAPEDAGGSVKFTATPVCVSGAWPFFVRAWQSVVNRSLSVGMASRNHPNRGTSRMTQ